MDAGLFELLRVGNPGDEVPVILRLARGAPPPAGFIATARFGDVLTGRAQRGAIPTLRESPGVLSLKSARAVRAEDEVLEEELPPEAVETQDTRRPEVRETGAGVVVGVIDWGCDFAHPDFLGRDGRSRLLALWDQRGGQDPRSPMPYGYGRQWGRDELDAALASGDPYEALGYRPADADPDGLGTHGTHVLSIAAGSGTEWPSGLAPGADLVFVHLATSGPATTTGKLGDSVTLLEAVDFVQRTAGGRPWVVNCSMGRHGEQHDGTTLVEQALDALLEEGPGRQVCISGGNYYRRRAHSQGRLRPGGSDVLAWEVPGGDPTTNQLEVWYDGRDTFDIEVESPSGARLAHLGPGEQAELRVAGEVVGTAYHRTREPNTLDNHVEVFLYAGGPAGTWRVAIEGRDVVDGRYHAWIERDPSARHQSQFGADTAIGRCTTGTICNGRRTIAVGAYDGHNEGGDVAPFSSSGPTRDGRLKPDLLAPGVRVLAARSAGDGVPGGLVRKSGTSMAAPHVTGAIALMFEAAGRPMPVAVTQRLLLSSTRPAPFEGAARARAGSGYLDVTAAVEAARRWGASAALRTHRAPLEGLEQFEQFEEDEMTIDTSVARAENEDEIAIELASSEAWLDDELAEACGGDEADDHLDGDALLGGYEDGDDTEACPSDVTMEDEADMTDMPLLESSGPRSTPAYIRWVQNSLNRVAGERLAVDGVSGPLTRAAVRRFQTSRGLTVDGIVGPQTEAALVAAGAPAPPGGSNPPPPPSTDVVDARIDVGAQFAIQRMRRGDAAAVIDGNELLEAVRGGRLAGIYGDDLGRAAELAGRLGTVRWELVPAGEDAAIVLEPATAGDAPPTLVFRAQVRERPERLDPALRQALATFRMLEGGQLVSCDVGPAGTSAADDSFEGYDELAPTAAPRNLVPRNRRCLVAPARVNTSPAHWFLSEAEIAQARGGGDHGRRTLSVSTSENLVQPLVDGEEYMAAVQRDIAAAGSGDFVHFTAWRLDRTMDLTPAPGSARNPVERLWADAIRRGATSRTLLWRNQPANHGANSALNGAGGTAILDARHPSAGSHHQKSGVVQRGGEAVAYCGGIDICADRWDTRLHDSPAHRVRENHAGWHDVSSRLRGPAVRDIELNFRDRWNDRTIPSLVPPVRPPTPVTGPLPTVAARPGTHHVQVLRTFACASRQYPGFAPRGEFTGLAGYLKAISRAQRYIYIEEQYLVSLEVARAIAAVLPRLSAVVIVVPRDNDYPAPVRAAADRRQTEFLAILRAAGPTKVHVFHPVQPSTGAPIYVHSKVMIIDDIYAVIGSTNVNRRSMTHDTELSVAVVDADIVDGVCRFARDFRRNLWGEHLGLPASSPALADPMVALPVWIAQAAAGTFRMRLHTPPAGAPRPGFDSIADPDGRC